MELKYEIVFKDLLMNMNINLLHPDTVRDTKWVIYFILKHGITSLIFVVIVHNMIFLNLKDNDFSQTCKNGTIAVVFVTTEFQNFILMWKERFLLKLMSDMKKDYVMTQQFTEKEQAAVKEYADRATKMYRSWMNTCCMVLGTFPFVNLILIINYWVKGDFHWVPLYDLTYPAFIENKKDTVGVFLLTYLALIAYGVSATAMTISFVPLGPSYMLHACGQLEVVKLRIQDLFKGNNIAEVNESLKQIVKRLQYIYDFVDNINQAFGIAYEVTLKAATVMLPVTCYAFVDALKRKELSVEFFSFIVGGTGLNSIICFYCDLLQEKSEDLIETVYSCGWEKVYDRGTHSIVKIILLRAQRPMAIRTLFMTVCLNTLTGLFNQSYTLFNLMNAAWN